jgi:hypothetical protein
MILLSEDNCNACQSLTDTRPGKYEVLATFNCSIWRGWRDEGPDDHGDQASVRVVGRLLGRDSEDRRWYIGLRVIRVDGVLASLHWVS